MREKTSYKRLQKRYKDEISKLWRKASRSISRMPTLSQNSRKIIQEQEHATTEEPGRET